LFGNTFAHSPQDIDPHRPLDNESLTALNLGWTHRTLAPGEGLTVAFALGLAETNTANPGELPRAPDIPPADWSVWRRHLKQGANPKVGDAVDFAAERVELTLGPTRLQVEGTYFLRNRGSSATSVHIRYPILSGADRPLPTHVQVEDRPVRVDPKTASADFTVPVPAFGLARFRIRYVQPHSGNRAGYMVTSARRWPAPLPRAMFVIRHPASMGKVTLSYAPDASRELPDGKTIEHIVVRQPFTPKREMWMRWRKN
jgi:hypothetical protein